MGWSSPSKPLLRERGDLMLKSVVGVFIVLHGLVHLLYFGQSMRLFELQSGMVWPDDSWLFSRLMGGQTTRWVAALCCVLAAIGFVGGGAAILLGQPWWRPAVVGTAVFSTVLCILFWDGKLHQLANQGLIAVLMNVGILIAVLLLGWPRFEF
jgi:hypothetical protein